MRADRDSVRRKLKIARGQLDGILQMIDDDRYCVDISNQLLATQSLLKSANQQIMRAHIEGCVREALQTDHIDPKLEEAFQLLVTARKTARRVFTRRAVSYRSLNKNLLDKVLSSAILRV